MNPAFVPVGELQTYVFTGMQDDGSIAVYLHWQQYCDRRTNKNLYFGYFSYQGSRFTIKTRVSSNKKNQIAFAMLMT
ncbi:MAG TPA: hypothetical protein IGS53_25065 [Leptolyngbyaceae cyanobacterium M33_DOE_097]|uniref:Uncharacterized protein n=1 Tax=Oscillatoriales cyanobacterium SpSt-418 TaxID=2282169 RepID=A0A7C3KBX0_9CYAN|nr:hypothetical protein [Leptolyngbyaceae cyanobacterium M33_DOE_097]